MPAQVSHFLLSVMSETFLNLFPPPQLCTTCFLVGWELLEQGAGLICG